MAQAYEVGISSPHFALSGTTSIEAVSSTDAPSWPKPSLTSDGTEAFREAVRKEVDACMAQKTLKAGCDLGTIPDKEKQQGWTMVDGTVEGSLADDTEKTLKTMKPKIDSMEPTSVEGPVIGTVDTTMSCTKGRADRRVRALHRREHRLPDGGHVREDAHRRLGRRVAQTMTPSGS